MDYPLSPDLWVFIFTASSFVLGLIAFSIAFRIIPKAVEHITPNIDEAKELINGNQAVGSYYGMVTAAAIVGVSLIIAASILAGAHAFL